MIAIDGIISTRALPLDSTGPEVCLPIACIHAPSPGIEAAMNTVVDSHHHFWNYSPAEYGWIGDRMHILRRNFLPQDLRAQISAAGVDEVISVQARQTVAETDWLLDLAEPSEFIRGVVGWAPLIDGDVRRHLDRWAGRNKLLALRHVLQDETDDRYMLRPDFNAGVSLLKEYGLGYDILIFERQLPGTIEFVDLHPGQVFILDHIAKPRIAAKVMEPWKSQIAELARRPHVYCKISGMATEAEWQNWKPDELRPYFETVLQAFGPSRLMFGSDWPVCLVACAYETWVQIVEEWVAPMSATEKQRIWGETALEAYGLNGPK